MVILFCFVFKSQGNFLGPILKELLDTLKHILYIKEKLNKILAEKTGQDYETIARDTERDNWMTAQQALEYGIVDKIIEKR